MAYNFLTLVNNVNARLNEVPLSASDFATATGFYSDAKDSVNSALREINQVAFEWPFNHVTEEETLVPGQVRYTYPTDANNINFDSFRVSGPDITARMLTQLDYEEYLSKWVDADTKGEDYQGIPRHVFRTPDSNFGIFPPADDSYTLTYEYYRNPVDLVLATDVPYVPEQFRHVIVEGAIQYAYMFRGDPESAMVAQQKFTQGIKNMRSIYQNRYEYVRSGMIVRNRSTAGSL